MLDAAAIALLVYLLKGKRREEKVSSGKLVTNMSSSDNKSAVKQPQKVTIIKMSTGAKDKIWQCSVCETKNSVSIDVCPVCSTPRNSEGGMRSECSVSTAETE